MFNRSLQAQLAQLKAMDEIGVAGLWDSINDLEWRLQQRSLRWQLYRFTAYVQNRLGYS